MPTTASAISRTSASGTLILSTQGPAGMALKSSWDIGDRERASLWPKESSDIAGCPIPIRTTRAPRRRARVRVLLRGPMTRAPLGERGSDDLLHPIGGPHLPINSSPITNMDTVWLRCATVPLSVFPISP